MRGRCAWRFDPASLAAARRRTASSATRPEPPRSHYRFGVDGGALDRVELPARRGFVVVRRACVLVVRASTGLTGLASHATEDRTRSRRRKRRTGIGVRAWIRSAPTAGVPTALRLLPIRSRSRSSRRAHLARPQSTCAAVKTRRIREAERLLPGCTRASRRACARRLARATPILPHRARVALEDGRCRRGRCVDERSPGVVRFAGGARMFRARGTSAFHAARVDVPCARARRGVGSQGDGCAVRLRRSEERAESRASLRATRTSTVSRSPSRPTAHSGFTRLRRRERSRILPTSSRTARCSPSALRAYRRPTRRRARKHDDAVRVSIVERRW